MSQAKYKPTESVGQPESYEESVCVNCGSHVRRPRGAQKWSHRGLIEGCGFPKGGDVTGHSFPMNGGLK